jgi:archaemetzincin
VGRAREGDEETVALLAEFLGAYFQTRIVVESRRPVPEEVPTRPSRGFGTQVLADDLLRGISREMPAGAVARLGIASDDLYGTSPGGGYLNFVFGMGAYAWRVGVFSSARYNWHYAGEPEGMTPRRRVLKVAAHETGHILGLAHCQEYACCMNGSNSLPESDSRPVHLCPGCLEKLAWHLGFDPAARYRALEELYRGLGWEAEAAFARRRAAKAGARPSGGVGLGKGGG